MEEKAENNRKLRYVDIAAIFAVFLFLFIFAMRNICSYDYWWHVASGRWILENGIMHSDPFSYTAAGAPLIDPYWLGQVILYLLGGFVVPFKVVLICAAFTFSLLAAPKRLRISASAAALTLLGIFVAHERFLARPEIFTLLLCAVTVWILFQPAERKKWFVFLIPVLAILWVNLHPGWVLAPLLAGAFGLGRLLGRWTGFSTDDSYKGDLAAVGAALLCFPAALVNPYFAGGVLYPFKLTLGGGHDVGAFVEWVSPLPRLSENLFSLDLIHFKLLALALIASFAANYRKFDFGKAAVSLMALALALTSLRHLGLFTLVSIPVVLHNLEPLRFERFVPKLARAAVSVIIILTALYYCEEAATNRYYARRELYSMSFGAGVSKTTFPTSRLAWNLPREVNIFNSYELGGYFIYRNIPVFIDGRLVHYPKEVYEDYVRIQAEPDRWEEFATKYDIGAAALIHNLPRMQALIKHLDENPGWQLAALDGVACVYIKSDTKAESFVEVPSSDAGYPEFAALSLGRFFLNTGRLEEAVRVLAEHAGESSGGKIHLYYGRALAESGQLTKAAESLKRALDLMPGSSEAHLNLGVVYWRLERPVDARREWERALELDPGSEEALRYLSVPLGK